MPSFDADLSSFRSGEVHESELLWPLSDWIEKHHARKNEIFGGSCRFRQYVLLFVILRITFTLGQSYFSFFFYSVVPKDQIQFFNEICFFAEWVEESYIDTGVSIVIAMLFFQNHMQFLLPHLECFFENDALSNFDHLIKQKHGQKKKNIEILTVRFIFEMNDSVVHLLRIFGFLSLFLR